MISLLLDIATNESALFCIDNKLPQLAFFMFTKVFKGRLSSYVKDFIIKRFSAVVCLFIS